MSLFSHFTECQRLDTDPDIQTHKSIVLAEGRHCWYNGYYHKEPFQERVRYTFPELDTINELPVDRLFIGNFCQFASGTVFMLGGNHGHSMKALTPHSFNFLPSPRFLWEPTGDIVIGHDVWTGYESMIMSGARIGNGAIIGARAIVTKEIPPYAIVVGNNQIVGYRFDEPDRDLMERIAWWQWDDDRLNEAMPLLQGQDLAALARFANIETE